MSRLDSPVVETSASKRKRDIIPENEDDKLEIDIALPEPPSKKAKRKEKKLSTKKPIARVPKEADDASAKVSNAAEADDDLNENATLITTSTGAEAIKPKASADYGIWIGNLPFKANKESLRQFFLTQGSIGESDITRLHMPTAEKGQNKGFAYVDFTTPAVLEVALALSEKLLLGRKVLIKNAKSFEGRPEKSKDASGKEADSSKTSKKEPSKRVFVGNLSFDVTRDDIVQHFSHAGPIEDVFMATFEDTGKCKGFGWVRFGTIEAATNAVKGFVLKEAEPDDSDEEDDEPTPATNSAPQDEPDSENEASDSENPPTSPVTPAPTPGKKKKKPHKWFLNRIHGRTLRCEFAEDAQTRYKKRFGKDKPLAHSNTSDSSAFDPSTDRAPDRHPSKPKPRGSADERRDERRKRFDARKIAPGQALANAQRATGAIVAGKGTKQTFE